MNYMSDRMLLMVYVEAVRIARSSISRTDAEHHVIDEFGEGLGEYLDRVLDLFPDPAEAAPTPHFDFTYGCKVTRCARSNECVEAGECLGMRQA